MSTPTPDEKIPILDEQDDQQLHDLAVKRVERKHRFRMRAFSYAIAAGVLVIIWALSEYHNAGGWPSSGFSQSSGIHHVWNDWIIYPVLGLGLVLALDAWNTFRSKPITDTEINREMERLKGAT